MTTQATQTLASWIQQNSSQDDEAKWFPLTFRVDSTIRSAAAVAQSPWSTNPTHAIQLVLRALDWSVTELRRYHKGLQFISWIGGDEAVGVRSHIHALVRVPDNREESEFIKHIERLWCRNLSKTLKTSVKASVWVDHKSLQSGLLYSSYASRSEAVNSVRGTDKVLLGKSFFLEPVTT